MSGTRLLSLGAACALLNLAAGCSKKPEAAPEPAASAETSATPEATAATAPAAPAEPAPQVGGLPGESGVRQALTAKDYSGAVSRLIAMQGSVRREQWEQYVSLQYEVRNTLGEVSATEPKAAEALLTLNALNRGR